MKKSRTIAIFLLIAVTLIMGISTIGCSKESAPAEPQAATQAPAPAAPAPAPAQSTPEKARYADGIYFAQEADFASNGWKYMVTITVKDGKITAADWNGANKNAGYDKKTTSASGAYGMVAFGKAQAEWHEQAAAAEAYLLKTQDPTSITYTDADGHTDAIAGVSIHVVEFFDLAEQALSAGPTGKGPYKDGHYHAQAAEFAGSGWKESVDLTVINGYIVAANWNAGSKDGGTDKKTRSASGAYGMVAFGKAQAEWHEQAAAAEAYLLQIQDPEKITYSDNEGHTDAIAGASIHVNGLFDLAKEALAAGPTPLGPYKDGTYHAEAKEFANGWKTTVDITVISGNIFSVNWNAVNADGLDKKKASADGTYGMVAKGGAQAEWHVQAAAAEAYLVKVQDPTKITYSDAEGHTDAIAGASIHVSELFTLAQEALAAGPVKQ